MRSRGSVGRIIHFGGHNFSCQCLEEVLFSLLILVVPGGENLNGCFVKLTCTPENCCKRHCRVSMPVWRGSSGDLSLKDCIVLGVGAG